MEAKVDVGLIEWDGMVEGAADVAARELCFDVDPALDLSTTEARADKADWHWQLRLLCNEPVIERLAEVVAERRKRRERAISERFCR